MLVLLLEAAIRAMEKGEEGVETRERAFACWRSESKLLRGIAGWFLDLGQPCYPYSPSSTPSAPRTNEHSPIPSVSFRFILLEAPRRLETSSNYREEGKESSKSRFLRSLLFSSLSLSLSLFFTRSLASFAKSRGCITIFYVAHL